MTRAPIPAEPKPSDVVAIVDTREELPLDLRPLLSCTGTLVTGDYSVKGLESVIALERKSLGDLLSCCGAERQRFERELQRLLGYQTRAVIVETAWSDLHRGAWRSNIRPESVVGSVLGWIALGIPFVMALDRDRAAEYMRKILFITARRRWRENRGLFVPNGELRPVEPSEGTR